MRRCASAWAWSRISAMICVPCSRASSRSRAASCRASASCVLYCSSVCWASACASSARLMPPSIASVRSSSAVWMRGTRILPRKNSTTRDEKMPMIISAASGSSGFGFLLSAASVAACTARFMAWAAFFRQKWAGSGVDEGHDQTDEGERLAEGEAQDHVLADHVGHLRLAGHGLNALAEDDTDADARTDGREAIPDGPEAGVDVGGGGEDLRHSFSF